MANNSNWFLEAMNKGKITPKQLTDQAKTLINPNFFAEKHPDEYVPGDNPLVDIGKTRYSASGMCDKACRWAHEFLPHGRHEIEYKSDDGNHVVHHVPTTEGMYVVDYSHRQFKESAAFPVVQPLEEFKNRPEFKKYNMTPNTESMLTEHVWGDAKYSSSDFKSTAITPTFSYTHANGKKWSMFHASDLTSGRYDEGSLEEDRPAGNHFIACHAHESYITAPSEEAGLRALGNPSDWCDSCKEDANKVSSGYSNLRKDK